MIENALYVNGKVVVRFKQPIPKLISVNDKQIYFEAKYDVSLAFVDEEDVPALLEYLGGCCGKREHVISLATASAYSHWQDGQGGR